MHENWDMFRMQQPFANESDSKCNPAVIDQINQKHSKNIIYFAAKGTKQNWSMKRSLLSPAYTTKWSDLPKI